MSNGVFVTDFDGVLCDSVHECLFSSYNAYASLGNNKRASSPKEIADSAKKRFSQLRPYIRSGEDYLLAWELIDNGIDAPNQAIFDNLRHSCTLLPRYKEALYAERERLLKTDKQLWLQLNPLYESGKALKSVIDFARIIILTTKKKPYVIEILGNNRILMPEKNIIYTPPHEKIQNLERTLKGFSFQDSVFIEDQVEFLIGAKPLGVNTFLADWSYTCESQKEKARQNGIEVINTARFREILRPFT